MKVLLTIFNYSVKKLSNLESSFLIIDTSWKNKTPKIPTKTFRMVIYLSKTFLEIQPFFIVWHEKQMIFALLGTGSQKGRCLTAQGLAKLLPRIQKLYQIKYIFCNSVICFQSTLWYQLIGTKRNPWVTVCWESPTNYSHKTSTLKLKPPEQLPSTEEESLLTYEIT